MHVQDHKVTLFSQKYLIGHLQCPGDLYITNNENRNARGNFLDSTVSLKPGYSDYTVKPINNHDAKNSENLEVILVGTYIHTCLHTL